MTVVPDEYLMTLICDTCGETIRGTACVLPDAEVVWTRPSTVGAVPPSPPGRTAARTAASCPPRPVATRRATTTAPAASSASTTSTGGPSPRATRWPFPAEERGEPTGWRACFMLE